LGISFFKGMKQLVDKAVHNFLNLHMHFKTSMLVKLPCFETRIHSLVFWPDLHTASPQFQKRKNSLWPCIKILTKRILVIFFCPIVKTTKHSLPKIKTSVSLTCCKKVSAFVGNFNHYSILR